jgi:DNA ligase-associated metallophosphoesterase
MLIVADLHLEKGSAFARRGCPLPPYDTHATLARLEVLIRRWQPEAVVSLGDAFHDRRGPDELASPLCRRLAGLMAGRRWIWVAGNHDPALPPRLGGERTEALTLDGLVLHHRPHEGASGEIAGHLHPKARVLVRGRSLRRPCFAVDNERILMPALGSLTGGLNVLDPAINRLFPTGFSACLLGKERVFRFPAAALAPDPAGPTLIGRAGRPISRAPTTTPEP